MVDEEILRLTFVCEDKELGSRKVVELCPGKITTVNSENREIYVNILVEHHSLTSIAHQITHLLESKKNRCKRES
uniref:HECT-type E3 ubiquitin transferase n=1 Tax=Solanum lycopersicum TaxID=4081 RepID=A0A3Q7I276_SOLLC